MRNLLLFFLRFGGFLLFFLLEVLSFILIVHYNQEQQVVFNNTWAKYSALADRGLKGIENYAFLGRENDSLSAVNAHLYEELLYYKHLVEEMRLDTMRTDHLDSLGIDTIYKLIPATVIRNSISGHHNYLILDKGSDQGIEPNMGVILDKGIVGIVKSVGRKHALVMSVLHRQSHPSASIKGTNYFGSLRWGEEDPQRLFLDNVPKHANPVKNDIIVTSGYSLIFPKGIPIGKIESFSTSDGGSETYEITVRLFSNLANIERVFVLKKLTLQEQQSLVQQTQDE